MLPLIKKTKNIIYALKSPNALPEINFRLRAPFFIKSPIYIVSFPKSGRTWLKAQVGRYLQQKTNLLEINIMYTPKLSIAAGLHPTFFSHDGSPIYGSHYTKMKKMRKSYKNSKVIFLVREPRDVLVSYYFHVTKRYKRFNGTLGEFIRSDLFPLQRLLTFYNIWKDNENTPLDFLLIKYEEMHSDPEMVLNKVLTFMDEKNIDYDLMHEAIMYTQFDNLQQMEKTTAIFDNASLKIDKLDTESLHIRRGKIGGYADYFTKEDLAFIDEVMNELGCSYYKK
jgi:hypothetical protein